MRFLYQTKIYRLNKIKEIKNLFNNDNPMYFINGSLGDHAIVAGFLKSYVENYKTMNIITSVNYTKFFQSFSNELNIISLSEDSLFQNYFINETSWLYDDMIIPTLPVYYPIIPEMMDGSDCLEHTKFIKHIMKIPKNIEFSSQINKDELKRQIIIKYNTNFTNTILIALDTNSVKNFTLDIIYDIIGSIDRNTNIIINNNVDVYGLNEIFKDRNLTFYQFPPEEIFIVLELVDHSILGPSGLSQFSKFLCHKSKIITITDWRNGGVVFHYNGYSTESIRQEHQFTEKINTKIKYFRLEKDSNFKKSWENYYEEYKKNN